MNDPVRLLDDVLASDLSAALRAEREVAAALDGAALKQRVLENVAAGAVPSALSVTASTWTTTALPALLAGIVGMGVGVAVTLAVVEPNAPTANAAAPIIAATPTPRVEEPSPAPSPLPPVERPRRPALSSSPSASSSASLSASSSKLADETRRYERAEAALRDGRPGVSVDELRDYLKTYPGGSLHNEARLTLLEALFANGRFADARDLAKDLVDDRQLADRRGEIVRVLVRSRVRLGECDAAAADLATLRGAPPALVTSVAQCRADLQPE
jgi:TolA-binding protein